jgi:hypothetical protein
MEKQTKKYNRSLVNKKRESLRRLCYNEDNNEIRTRTIIKK